MRTTIIGALGSKILTDLAGNLFGHVEGIFEKYFQKQIAKEQLLTELQKALWQPASKFPIMQMAWAAVVYSQLVVLVWARRAT